jgi:hypothetical protein
MPAVITERVFTTPPFGLTLSALLALSVFATPVKPLSNRAPNVTQLSAGPGTPRRTGRTDSRGACAGNPP